jgi:hypothetical protein
MFATNYRAVAIQAEDCDEIINNTDSLIYSRNDERKDYITYIVEKGASYSSGLQRKLFTELRKKVKPIEDAIIEKMSKSERYLGVQSYIYKDHAQIELSMQSGDDNHAFQLKNIPFLQDYKVCIHTVFFKDFQTEWEELSQNDSRTY